VHDSNGGDGVPTTYRLLVFFGPRPQIWLTMRMPPQIVMQIEANWKTKVRTPTVVAMDIDTPLPRRQPVSIDVGSIHP
jgi:hypothetical protein